MPSNIDTLGEALKAYAHSRDRMAKLQNALDFFDKADLNPTLCIREFINNVECDVPISASLARQIVEDALRKEVADCAGLQRRLIAAAAALQQAS